MQTSPYQYSTGSDAASWTTHSVDNQAVQQNGNYSNSSYYHPQPPVPATGNVQETSSSTSGTVNVAQDYSAYTPYQTPSDPQNYSNTGYTNYYSGGYQQQQPSQPYPQPVGAYQNTGAPYSSFQNPGSYAGTASYSGTYYNPADYQTTAGGYQSTAYNSQTAGGYVNQTPTSSNQGNYTSNPYQNYTPDAANIHSATAATATPVHYQQSYQQWPGYYSQTEVPCAPGTEKLPATSTFSQSFPVAGGAANEMPASNGQPAPSYAQTWRQETDSSQPPSQQVQIYFQKGV